MTSLKAESSAKLKVPPENNNQQVSKCSTCQRVWNLQSRTLQFFPVSSLQYRRGNKIDVKKSLKNNRMLKQGTETEHKYNRSWKKEKVNVS